ncbi:hypothetical protein B0H19DRAFT_1263705 [Mycena capillaripes]|nr:hypothetical protein B0H19DRAFT_1263705 [Mycena capillaripes]
MDQPRSLPPPPQTQARRPSTFVPPPLDGTLTIAEIYDWHFEHTPLHRLFVYARTDESIREIYWPEAVQAIYTGAGILRNRFQWTAGIREMPVVSILASSDTIPYFILFMSCLRANYVPFPISPRNSPSAVANLISKAGVSHLLIGREPAMMRLADHAVRILKEQYSTTAVPDVSYALLFEELFVSVTDTSVASETLPFEYKGPDATACIMHSSGSTAFPKPIYWSNHRTIEASLIPWFGERDLTNQILSLHSMPMYHGMGILQTFWSAACGLVLSAFEPKSPPTIPTPENLFNAARATGSDIIFCVPSFIETWSRRPEYIQWLVTREGVLYGGGPLNKEAGDYMTSQGVSIFILYGSSEGGIMSPILPSDLATLNPRQIITCSSAQVGYDWEYFRFPELVTAEMVPHGNNTFELVMVTNKFCRPAVLNTQVGGIDAYATSDLLVPHPVKSGYWKIYGRTDDQIMHNTGEKTNPGPLENILNQDTRVLSSVMFGRGRFQAGVIVDPKPAFKFDPSDSVKLAEFRNKIWPTVVKMNEFAPQHSRLFKEMILVPKPDKPFTYTAKMTVRRQAVIADYETEIAALYDTVEETTALNIPPLVEWDMGSVRDFVRNAIHKVMIKELGDDEDIFQYGCDSLQATWIRNCLLGALRDLAQLDTRRDTRNFVYEYPTISRLAHFVFEIASGQHEEDASMGAKYNAMHGMVAKYSQDFPTHTGERQVPSPGTKVVLVTGTTGELGCYLLSLLVADPAVAQVYVINRSSPQQLALRDRHARALVKRGLDASILESSKVSLLSGDVSKLGFDLPAPVYREMQQGVTHIIHTAWPVDFNLALASFEPNMKGLRNLVDFSLGSPFMEPPRLLYTSSIGIFKNGSKNIFTETPVDSDLVGRNGYQESKWISEQILAKAAAVTPAKPLIIRVGQLSGGINGAWNIQEWVPAIIQSANFIGCIPEDSRDVTWLPVHIAAAAIIDFLEVDPSTKIVHLINPHPVSWLTLGNIIADELSVRLVPYAEWLSQVENVCQTQGNSKTFRALRLLPFFRSQNSQTDEGEDAFGFPKLDMRNALSASQSLRSPNCQLREKDVRQWIGYWRSAGLL